MTTISSLIGLYAGGCVLSMIFFFMGRWPALSERNWHWPVIFLWPLVLLWPLRRLARFAGGPKAGANQASGGTTEYRRE